MPPSYALEKAIASGGDGKNGAFSEGGQLKTCFCVCYRWPTGSAYQGSPPAATHPQVTAFCIFLSN